MRTHLQFPFSLIILLLVLSLPSPGDVNPQPPICPADTPPTTPPTTVPKDNIVMGDNTNRTNSQYQEFQDHSFPLAGQPILSTSCISAKTNIRRLVCSVCRLSHKIKEVTIGNAKFAVHVSTGPLEDSCFIEYVSANHRWRASVHPSGIPPRGVQETELTPGCRKLFTDAGSVFKTAGSTDIQDSKPIEIPSRSLRSVMRSLGFCQVDGGTLYRVYKSRFGRPMDYLVIIQALVGFDGENQSDYIDAEADTLLMKVEVLQRARVAPVVRMLKARDSQYRISLQGRQMVKRKLRGQYSVLLV